MGKQKELKIGELVRIRNRTYKISIKPPNRFIYLKRVFRRDESLQGRRD